MGQAAVSSSIHAARHTLRCAFAEALQFGAEPVKATDLAQLDLSQAPIAWLVCGYLLLLDSASARQGQTVDAVIAAPLFSAEHKLVLPEGTHLLGMVTMAKSARSFHRTGRLRFTFQKVELAPEIANLRPRRRMCPRSEHKRRWLLRRAEDRPR